MKPNRRFIIYILITILNSCAGERRNNNTQIPAGDISCLMPNDGIIIIDPNSQKISRYSIYTGEYISSIKLNNNTIRSYRIQIVSDKMYSDAYMPSDLAQGSFLLREINMENGEQGSFWMPSSQYNKGWNELYFTKQNEFIQDNKLTAKYCRTFMDFSDAKLLHRINHIPAMSYQEVVLKGAANYRYARYKSQPSGFCNVAEIEFYGPDGNKLKGANIGLPGSWDDSEMSCDKAFDNNVMTFYDAAKKDSLTAWTGLDFHENKLIGKIRYLPRTDGYGIYEGHRYKVFCWTGKGWEAFSETIANGN